MRRVDLPGGQWADLRDPEEITTRGRRGIQSIAVGLTSALPRLQNVDAQTDMSDLDLSEAEMDAMLRLQEATVVAFLAAWSLDRPLPTLDTVGDLPVSLYDPLSLATAKDGANVANSLTLDVSPGKGASPDPKAPSGASAASDGSSKESAAPPPPTLT